MKRKKIPPSDRVLKWYRKIGSFLRSEYFPTDSKKRKDFIAILAGYTALIGPLGDKNAQNFIKTIRILFPHKHRTKRWYSAVEILPANREKLISFSTLIQEYEKLAAQRKVVSLQRGKVNLENVVYYALRFSKHKQAFLDAASVSWMNYPSVIFSEQFLREAARSHRGAFGDFSNVDYDHDLDSIEVIE